MGKVLPLRCPGRWKVEGGRWKEDEGEENLQRTICFVSTDHPYTDTVSFFSDIFSNKMMLLSITHEINIYVLN